ncbi:MAG: LysR family transcriptional regulator [SAR324 cluster bacterium]|nr:LysR family transcriptional regulator [SAR324 cluster bacterium]MBL7034353.1 LysR family transcriptional regulator [SAR324 cluster bacterium]
MSYTQLRSFHAVARAGGFTAASKVLHVGQPTITGQVRALEDYYGVELFHRRGRRVELTETGKELYAVTQRMEVLENEAQEILHYAGGFQAGHLRIGAVGPYHVTEMLAVFHERYPQLKITVTVGNSQEILESLLNFEVDVAVLSQTDEDPRLLSIPFCQEPLVVFVNSAHPWAERKTLRIEELEGQSVIMREPGSTTRRAFEKALKQAKIKIQPVMEIGSREAVWLAVARGLGIGVVSDYEFLEHPELRKLQLVNADVHTEAYVVCLRERRDSRMIHAFLEIVEELSKL